MNADKLEQVVYVARRREDDDDHLTDEERKFVVDSFLDIYLDNDEVRAEFPFKGDLAEQFVYVIYEWH